MNRAWILTDAPTTGLPRPENFALRQGPIPSPGPGQALTRTIYISLDPYQWGYKKKGVEKPGQVCHARTVSQVMESRMAGFAPGDFVFNVNGWQEFGLMGEGAPRPVYMNPRRLDPELGPISYAVGLLGMLGLTAYAGMVLEGAPKPGETVVVSAASGGVGQIAGQLARLHGARVVGIAGREEKRRYVVEELGFDGCVSHLSPTFGADLAAACPQGVDVFFENVGGAVFDAVVPLLNPHARAILCGAIAEYGDDYGSDLMQVLITRGAAVFQARDVKTCDLFVGNYVADHETAFLAKMARWVADGQVRYREDIRTGLESTPAVFGELLRGGTFGKTLVQVADDPTRSSRP